MKLLKSSLLLSLGFCSSVFAFDFGAISNPTLSCPASFPNLASPSPVYQATGFYGIMGNMQQNDNFYSMPVVLVHANNLSDAESKAVSIATSGLTPYSLQPTPDPILGTYDCNYRSSSYTLYNETPGEAEASKTEAAVLILYPEKSH